MCQFALCLRLSVLVAPRRYEGSLLYQGERTVGGGRVYSGNHICTDSRRFQNTARRFTKFPRTRAAPPFVVIVVEKECCAKILSTVNRYIYDKDAMVGS